MRSLRAIRVASCALVGILFSALAWGQIPVTDDSFTSSCAPSTSFGSSIALIVQAPTAPGFMASPTEPSGCKTISYLRFDVAGSLPSNLASVDKATLRLYVNVVISPGSFDVYLANGPWSEGSLTQNTAPPMPTHLVKSSVSVVKGQKYLDIDVTSAALSWLPPGTTNYGLVLEPSPGSNIFAGFDSKENPFTGHDPALYAALVYAGPQGAQGPQGPIGPMGPWDCRFSDNFQSVTTTIATVALGSSSAVLPTAANTLFGEFSTSTLAPGTHTITASYGGDANYNAVSWTALSLIVSP